jgi:heme oxygenase
VALFWRNLLPIYRALDGSSIGRPELARTAALEADLCILWPSGVLPELPEATAYANRIGHADAAGLIGHAYVRYLGDLNGGRVMQRRLQVALGALAEDLRFHAYPGIADLSGLAAAYRAELDGLIRSVSVAAVAAEAVVAFELNIALSEAVRRAV